MPHAAVIAWFDIPVSDLENGKAFYQALFHWEYTKDPKHGKTYEIISAEGRRIGGIYECKGMTASLLVPVIYFFVKDVRAACELAQDLGGKTATERTPFFETHYAHIQDPDGNLFGVYER